MKNGHLRRGADGIVSTHHSQRKSRREARAKPGIVRCLHFSAGNPPCRIERDFEHRFHPSVRALKTIADGPRLLVAVGDRLFGGGDGLRDVAAGLVGQSEVEMDVADRPGV
jgi:hypothetical protein